uniref:Angiotensin I converting enzyme (peptidyl-dipeptidase A) 1 n=1 Tax=Myripristis murdjan TaxID=586833 RepID=A0A668AAC3_9TELE
MARFLWAGVLLLPVLGLFEALPSTWLPGHYANTTADATRFAKDYNTTAEQVLFYSVSASWNYNTNLTDHNSELQVNASLEEQAFTEAWGLKAKEVFPKEFLDTLPDPKVKKLIEKISVLGAANLPPKEREEISRGSWLSREITTSCCLPGRAGETLLAKSCARITRDMFNWPTKLPH